MRIIQAASDGDRRSHPQIRSKSRTADRWWACWSPQQRCFHLETEREALEINGRAFALNHIVEYVPIAIFDDEQQARDLLTQLQAIRNIRNNGGSR